ncbi:MAG: PrgI family protein [Oscillospiraceae bacterium]
MAIETRIPKDIEEYKEKIIFGLSVRQLLCCTISLLLGGGLFYIFKDISIEISSYLVIILVMPTLSLGFIKINGIYLDKYIKYVFKHIFGTRRRVYKTKIEIQEVEEMYNGKEKQKPEREIKNFIPTKKDIKKRYKITKKTIKNAKRESKKAKRKAKKN